MPRKSNNWIKKLKECAKEYRMNRKNIKVTRVRTMKRNRNKTNKKRKTSSNDLSIGNDVSAWIKQQEQRMENKLKGI